MTDPALAIVEQLSKEQPFRTTLSNGLTVLLKEDPIAELVSIQLYVKTGSIHEGKYLGTGISHYVEHMLFKGTTRRTFRDISESIHASGGHANAYTTFDRTVYYIDTLAESLDLSLEILADMAFDSQFLEEECIKEREVILREIDMYVDDPDQQVGEASFKQAFRTHPYRLPIIGIKDAFLSLSRDALFSYYKERYVPNNMTLVIVGQLNIHEALKKIEAHFGKVLYQALPPYIVPQELPQLAQREERLYGPYNITRGQIAFKIPHLSHPDSPALDILAHILGQGQSSLLWQKLREELKLVYDIEAHAWKPGEEGLLSISYTCDNGKREQVETTIFEALETFKCTLICPKLLEKALRQALVGEINARKTASGQASRLGAAEVVIGDLAYPRLYLQKIAALSPEAIQAVAKAYLKPERSTLISLEEAAKTPPVITSACQTIYCLTDFELHTLPNGLRIALQDVPRLPKVSIRATLRGGVLYEDMSTYGLTGVLASLLTKDTTKRSALAVAQTLESLGIYFSEFAGNNSFGLSLEALESDMDIALDVLKEALLFPKLLPEAFEAERNHQIAQLKEDDDDILGYGRRILQEHFFGEHPYRYSALGSLASLANLRLNDTEKQLERLVVPSNIILTVSGAFHKERILEKLKQHFEAMPPCPSFEPVALAKPNCKQQRLNETLDREQALVLLAYPDCGACSSSYEVGTVVEEILNGLSSNLFSQIREQKGLAYYVGASRFIGMHSGMFYLYAGTHPAKAQEVLEAMQVEIQRIQSGAIHDSELARAKQHLKSKQRFALQSPSSRAAEAACNLLYHKPLNAFKTYDSQIESISKEAIQSFAQEHFRPELSTELCVLPKN